MCLCLWIAWMSCNLYHYIMIYYVYTVWVDDVRAGVCVYVYVGLCKFKCNAICLETIVKNEHKENYDHNNHDHNQSKKSGWFFWTMIQVELIVSTGSCTVRCTIDDRRIFRISGSRRNAQKPFPAARLTVAETRLGIFCICASLERNPKGIWCNAPSPSTTLDG